MHQCSVLSPFCFAVVVDVVTLLAREWELSEMMYAVAAFLMSEIIKELINKFLKWKDDFESNNLKVIL